MFIYSNHYLILSKLTQEDFKNYFTGIKGGVMHKNSYFNGDQPQFDMYYATVIEETGYLPNDYIDLGYTIYESRSFVYFGNTFMYRSAVKSPYKDSRFPFFPYFGSRNYAFEADNLPYVYEPLQNIEFSQYVMIIDDHISTPETSEHFFPMIWLGDRSFFLVPSKVEFDPTRENKEEFIERKKQDEILRNAIIMRRENIKLFYKDEDTKYKAYEHPKFRKIAPHNPAIIWLISELNATVNIGKSYRDYALVWSNSFVPRYYLLNDDKNDREYWHEPSFAFPIIRDALKSQKLGKDYVYPVSMWDAKKFEHQYPLKINENYFPLSFTGVVSPEFFTIPRYDQNSERFD
jgi:hypothetical protein